MIREQMAFIGIYFALEKREATAFWRTQRKSGNSLEMLTGSSDCLFFPFIG